jgi:hypothetical protein
VFIETFDALDSQPIHILYHGKYPQQDEMHKSNNLLSPQLLSLSLFGDLAPT